MTILCATCLAAGVPEAFTIHSLLTSASFVDRSGFAGKAISFDSVAKKRLADYIKPDRSNLTELYMAVQFENKADSSYGRAIAGLVHDSTAVFGICRAGGSPRNITAYRIDTNTNYVSLGSGTAALANSTVYNIEFRWKAGDADGLVQVWVNGVLDIDVSGVDTLPTGKTSVNMWILGAITDSTFTVPNSYMGELIVADARIHDPFTQRKTFAVLRPSGAGNNSQWSGSYSDVDEAVPDDSDGISVNTVDQVSTFALGNLPAGVESVNAVSVWNRIVGQGGPTPRNVQPAIRTNSNNYFGDSKPVTALRPWYGCKLWVLNPNTSSAWSIAEVNALEAGAKSVT